MRPGAAQLRFNGDHVQRTQRRAHFLVSIDRDPSTLGADRNVVRMLHPILFPVRGLDQKWRERLRMHEFSHDICHGFPLHECIARASKFSDLHATALSLLGLDYKRLTYRYAGRNFRLTDVYGKVAKELIA